MLTPIMPGTLLHFAMEVEKNDPKLAKKMKKTAQRHIEAENETVELDCEYFDSLLHVASHIHSMLKQHNDLIAYLQGLEDKDEDFRVPRHLKKPLAFAERIEKDQAAV